MLLDINLAEESGFELARRLHRRVGRTATRVILISTHGLELRRTFRNRRTVIFTLVVPAVLFLLFGSGSAYRSEPLGRGNVAGYVLVSMAV